ncbi:hypothetical protein WDU94_009938 [Cyamophila willieti]
MERDDKSKWQQAMKDEVSCHIKNKTFEICDVPPGKKPVKSKWVFKTKYNVDGTLNKYKARLVAKGYSQQEGIDYEEVFAPVVRHTSIRLLLALAVELNLSIDQMDVVTAFLHPKLDEEIYMELPRDDQFDGKCCKLLKSIYGLKQAKDMLYKSSEKRNEVLHIPYQEAFGSLLYIAQGTRPDIMYAVSYLSRFNNSFGPIHWNAVKRIMRYLKQTIDLKLTYKKNSNKDLYGFSDADWASDTIERKSTTGYAFFLSGGAISWNSKKQPTIALSTTEAEYMALSNAVQKQSG